ncbi:MAG: TIGR00730 family Rossman fold protein [Elusimicrobiota bacterium]|nr:TIGR00730 family Rossman fold protein [Elusimicrobiota bacterium]
MRTLRLLTALLLSAGPSAAAVGRVAPVGVTARLNPTPLVAGSAGLSLTGSLRATPAFVPDAAALGGVSLLSAGAPDRRTPLLPASLLAAPAPAPLLPAGGAAGVAADAPASKPQPLVFHSIKDFAAHILAGRGQEAADRIYSGARAREEAPGVVAPDGRPSIPVGVREVEVHSVRGPPDIARWIPSGSNSDGLREALRASLQRMLPFDIFVYRDALGGSFAAVDLSKNPANADRHPELAPHESAAIKKIQLWTKDLQVLVREEGKTPDLVVGGVVTELKSFHPQGDLLTTLTAANEQVSKHAQRHGLGLGAVVVDMMHRDAVPVELVRAKLAEFTAQTRSVAVARVYVFAGSELKAFSRGADGVFRLDEATRPFGRVEGRRDAPTREVHRVQLLTKAGRLEGARSRLAQLEHQADAGVDTRLTEAREQLDAERVFRKISKMVSHGRDREAYAVWDRFRLSHSAALVHQVADKVRAALKITLVPDSVAQARVPDSAVVVREITEPARRLREKGVRATVTVYGSARIKTPEAAAAALAEAQAAAGAYPRDAAAAKRVDAAKRDLAMSKYYLLAQRFGALVARKGLGLVAVVTGGGPGIMEAANKGAFAAGGPSVGYNIILEHEQSANAHITPGLEFEFENFATRKIALRHGAMALTYFPGGFGTMDELFEVLTLMQTKKMPRVPIVLMGEKEYWDQVLDFDEFARLGLISPGDLSLFAFAEDEHQAWAAIEKGVAAGR